jgi:hypothetical protein
MKKILLWSAFSIIFGCLALTFYLKIEDYLFKVHSNFVYCRMLEKGMTYSEVTKILHRLGEYEDKPYKSITYDAYYHEIIFKDPMINYLTVGKTYLGFRNDELFERNKDVSSDRYRICGD